MTKSELEETMLFQIRAVGLPEPVRELVFAPPRRWRFDFSWRNENLMVALEVEGGTWAKGRHTRGAGFEADCIKYAEATILGWKVLRVTGKMIDDGKAIEFLERLLLVGDDVS